MARLGKKDNEQIIKELLIENKILEKENAVLERRIERAKECFIGKNERNKDIKELVESARVIFKKVIKAEESCPDCFCEDCTKDCGIKKLGLLEK